MGDHLVKHGDGVKDIAFEVEDCDYIVQVRPHLGWCRDKAIRLGLPSLSAIGTPIRPGQRTLPCRSNAPKCWCDPHLSSSDILPLSYQAFSL